MGIDHSRIVAYEGEKYRYAAETLLYADWRNQSPRPGMHFCAPRGALRRVRASLAPHHRPLHERPNVILISRADTKHRKLLNEDAVGAVLDEVSAKHGKTFQLFIGQSISIKETIDLFKDASLLFSPHGAGIANAVWMGDGASVVEMPVHETHGRDMAHLAKSMGLDYWVTGGVHPFKFLSDFTADLDEIRTMAEHILAAQAAGASGMGAAAAPAV